MDGQTKLHHRLFIDVTVHAEKVEQPDTAILISSQLV